jgi:ribosomal 50S subunit-recycling heat shock protein
MQLNNHIEGTGMRLDKFLKVSRLVKRRTLAKELCDQGRIKLNGRMAKPGAQVSAGDQLLILYGQKEVVVQINHLDESPRKEEAKELYTVISEQLLTDSDPV